MPNQLLHPDRESTVEETARTAAAHVVVSELAVDPVGAESLESAFRDRLGEVDDFQGFIRLEVWRDDRRLGRYLMTTWWESPDAFRDYMRSNEHHRSHDRIPTEPARPTPIRVERFSLIAD